MFKICIWMNIPSHYQTAFFKALNERSDVGLKVAYFDGCCSERVSEGWNSEHDMCSFETFLEGEFQPENISSVIPDWSERVHIINGHFSSALIDWFCSHKTRWCHWSEMPGIRLAEMLKFHTSLYRMLRPLMLLMKRKEGRLIREYALGALGQGLLARGSFRMMGVPEENCADLFYVPEGLTILPPAQKIADFSGDRRVFLAVGALCRRKGIDLLIKAFADLDRSDWVLVFCGYDRSDGKYQCLARQKGVEDRVLFLGAHPAERMAEVYCASDVFILPSRFDGWGAVLNEAASLGVPMIGTDLCGGSMHLIREGETGYRVRAGSVRSLKCAMSHYVEAEHLVEEHGQAAKVLFNNEFIPERNAQRLVESLTRWSNG